MSSNWKKNIILFLTSQGITLFGSSLVQYAATWYVARETQSGILMTLMILCGFLPQVVISLFAGVWADRYNRKLLIIASDGGIAVVTLILAIIMMNTSDFYPALLVISAIRSVGAGIQTPAVNAMVPQIVPEEMLMKASGVHGSVMSAISIIAPMAAGAVLVWGEIHYIMFIDVVTAIIGITVMMSVPVLQKEGATDKVGGYFEDLKAGIKYGFDNSFLRRLLIYSGVFYFLIAPAMMLNVLFVTRVFGDDYWLLTFNEIAFFVGMLAGGALIGVWGGFDNRLKTLGVGNIIFATAVITFSFLTSFPLYLVALAVCGISVPMLSAPINVLIQEKVEATMQGRIFSLLQIVTASIIPLAMVVFGPLADVVDIRWIMLASGIALLLFTALLFQWKSFYNEGMKPSAE